MTTSPAPSLAPIHRRRDLLGLIETADPRLDAPQRHLWLIEAAAWLRGREASGRPGDDTALSDPEFRTGTTPLPVLRLRRLLGVLEQHAGQRAAVVSLLAACWRDLDASALLADFGFAPRAAFGSELRQRLAVRILPSSPDTADAAELFGLMFEAGDAAWLRAADAATLARVGALLAEAAREAVAGQPAALRSPLGWRTAFHDAITVLCSQVRAAGQSGLLRPRMSAALLVNRPFAQLARAADHLSDAAELAADPDAPGAGAAATALPQHAQYLRALLQACRDAAESVHEHLEEHGVSVDIVFQVDQLRLRTHRIEALLDCVLAPEPGPEVARLLADLIDTAGERRSVGALFRQHYSMLARKVAERSADTGEHYITRDRVEYRQMLRRALGGGSVLAVTTFLKFAIVAIGLSPFWLGFGAGLNYAISFVVVQLMHWTVATKQPAMTAPAMVARLAGLNQKEGAARAEQVERFVDEVAHLIRSQVAGIVGNLAAVAPLVALVQWGVQAGTGHALVTQQEAHYVLHSLTLLGPTVAYAAFTGVLLFASSQIAGWAENAFLLHRLESAMRLNPRIVALLGERRAVFWAGWWRRNVSGVAANVSLGFMLGLVPVLAGFFALPLDVRHVTLSTGQLAAAATSLSPGIWATPELWHALAWCACAIPLTALCNVGVSFYLAFRLALRARGVRVAERRELVRAIGRRVLRRPLSFLLPPREPRPPA